MHERILSKYTGQYENFYLWMIGFEVVYFAFYFGYVWCMIVGSCLKFYSHWICITSVIIVKMST